MRARCRECWDEEVEGEKIKEFIAAMPLLVTHRSRSCIAAVDHHQKLYGRFHYDQYPLNMSKCNSAFINGSNDDTGEKEMNDKKHVDEGK